MTNQRWLTVRLDFLGSLSIFSVAMLVVGLRFTVSPSETGVVLSYMLTVQQVRIFTHLATLRLPSFPLIY